MSLNKTKPNVGKHHNLDGFQTLHGLKEPRYKLALFRDGEQLRATRGWEGSDTGYCPLGIKEGWHSCAEGNRLGEGAVV